MAKVRFFIRIALVLLLLAMNQLISDLFHLLMPVRCLHCLEPLSIDEKELCFLCISHISECQFTQTKSNPLWETLHPLTGCELALAYGYFQQKGSLRSALHSIKYQGNKKLASMISARFAAEIKSYISIDHFDYIIPVPIHWTKKFHRGFNQSEIIAQVISNQSGIPMNTNTLKRRRGKSQTKKNRKQRFEDLKSAFYLGNSSELLNKNCLLVDDVFTTGATSIQCLNLLKKAGARNTGFLCLAYNSIY